MLGGTQGLAETQGNAGVVPAWCYVQRAEPREHGGAFCGGAHAGLWWGRSRDRDLGWGVGAGAFIHGFDDASVALGPQGVLPVLESLPLVLELDARLRLEHGRLEPGWRAQLFWGPLSHNFHSSYAMATGIVLAMDRDLDGTLSSVWVGARIDAMWLAIPFIAGYEWAVGGSE